MALSIPIQFVLAVVVVTLWRHVAHFAERVVVGEEPSEWLETDPLPRDGSTQIE